MRSHHVLVAFASQATNLVANDTNSRTDVFVRDRAAFAPAGETTTLASETEDVNGPKNIANEESNLPRLSRDGRYVAFDTAASNLVPDDTNNVLDIFTRFAVPPTVGGITPDFAARGTTLTVHVHGMHFLFNPDPTVSFGSGITVNTLSNESPSSVDVNITISNSAATGARPVFLLDAGTGPGATAVGGGGCASCFTVT